MAVAAAKEEKDAAEAMRQVEVDTWAAVAQAPPSPLLKRPLMAKRRQW